MILSGGSSSCSVVGISALCSLAHAGTSSLVNAGASSIFSAIAGWVSNGATWFLRQIGTFLQRSTAINVNANWFQVHYRAMAAIAAVIALPVLLVTTIQAVVRHDLGLIGRTALLYLPAALILTGTLVEVVNLCVQATDALSSVVASGAGSNEKSVVNSLTTGLIQNLSGAAFGVPPFVVLVLGLLVTIAALMLWVELAIRSAAIYLVVLFLPIALVGLLSPSISAWGRRLGEALTGLIASKFVIVSALTLAVSALGTARAGPAAAITGCALLLLATLAPFALFRLIPAVETGAVLGLEGTRRRLLGAASSFRPAASVALDLAMSDSIGPMTPSMVPAPDDRDAEPLHPSHYSGRTHEEECQRLYDMAAHPKSDWEKGTRPWYEPHPDPKAEPQYPPNSTSAQARGRHVITHDHIGPKLTFIPFERSDEASATYDGE